MQITVMRSPGDNQGPDIVDPLLTNDQVGRARGTREIDYNCSSRNNEACQCPKHDYMASGSLARIIEAADIWPGVIRYWSLTLTLDEGGGRYTADTRLSVERVEE